MGTTGELIRKDVLLDHIKGLPTWGLGEDGDLTKSMKYPNGYFYPEDVISCIENAISVEFMFDGPDLPEEKWSLPEKDSKLWECDMRIEGESFIEVGKDGGNKND